MMKGGETVLFLKKKNLFFKNGTFSPSFRCSGEMHTLNICSEHRDICRVLREQKANVDKRSATQETGWMLTTGYI